MKRPTNIVIGEGPLTDEHEARHGTELHKSATEQMGKLVKAVLLVGEAMQQHCDEAPGSCCPVCAILQAQGDLAYGLLNRIPPEGRVEIRDALKAVIDDVYLFVEKQDTMGSA